MCGVLNFITKTVRPRDERVNWKRLTAESLDPAVRYSPALRLSFRI
jgi:hypothetical protein